MARHSFTVGISSTSLKEGSSVCLSSLAKVSFSWSVSGSCTWTSSVAAINSIARAKDSSSLSNTVNADRSCGLPGIILIPVSISNWLSSISCLRIVTRARGLKPWTSVFWSLLNTAVKLPPIPEKVTFTSAGALGFDLTLTYRCPLSGRIEIISSAFPAVISIRSCSGTRSLLSIAFLKRPKSLNPKTGSSSSARIAFAIVG